MKLCTHFSLLICFILTLYSLPTIAQKAEMEVVAGPAMVYTRLSSGKNTDHKMKIAPLAGVGVNYHLTNHWSAGVKLLYEVKGSRDEATVTYFIGPNPAMITRYKYVINLNYLTLPVMVHYIFGKKIKWSAAAGGYIGYLIKAKQYITKEGDPTAKESFDVTQYYNNVDAGISMAIGIAIPVSNKLRLKGSLNESLGLVKIYEPTYPVTGPSTKTNSLSLQIGVSYLLGKQ